MRILEAFGEPIADGGQEAFVFGVMDRMNTSDMTIDCLTPYECRSERYRRLVEGKGGCVYHFDIRFERGRSRENIRKPLRRFLKNHKYDVIHIHSGSISVLAIMAAEGDRAGVRKVIVHSHATGFADSLKHRAIKWLASFSMRRHVDVYCACSKAAADWKFEPRYAAQARIIKNGIDVERFRFDPQKRQNVREKLGVGEDVLVIGHVGRFSRQKNHAFLINVFEELKRRVPDSILVLVGDGEDRTAIEAMVAERQMGASVIFTGSVENTADYYQAMDVFVLPSFYEGLGIVAIEAQAAGCPVVASNHVPEDIRILDDVFFLGLEDPRTWVDSILALRGRTRMDGAPFVDGAGYGVSETAEQIRKLYFTGV